MFDTTRTEEDGCISTSCGSSKLNFKRIQYYIFSGFRYDIKLYYDKCIHFHFDGEFIRQLYK